MFNLGIAKEILIKIRGKLLNQLSLTQLNVYVRNARPYILEIFMKRIVLSLGLCLAFVTPNYAANDAAHKLNKTIANVLAPFQNANTYAKCQFNTVEINDERAVKVSLNGRYRKSGLNNKVALIVDNLDYNYGDGSAPTTIFKSQAVLDLTKFVSQELLNGIFEYAGQWIEQYGSEYSEDYGDAASVRGVITSTKRDGRGNYIALSGLISAKIDLAKLPEDISRNEVAVTEAVISFSLDVKKGLNVDGYVVSNPDYLGFQSDAVGLKELLDGLLSQNKEVLANLHDYISLFDDEVEMLLESGGINNLGRISSSFGSVQRVMNLPAKK